MGFYVVTSKLVTLSVGVVWMAVMLRFMGPTTYVSLADWLPRVYMSVSGWLTPPYLYLIINGIILSIAASSRFSPPKSVPVKDSVLVPVPGQDPVQIPVSIPVPTPVSVQTPLSVPASVLVPAPDPIPAVKVPTPVPVPVPNNERKPIFEIPDVEEEEEFVIRGPRWDMEKREDEAVPAVYTESLVEPMVRADSMEMPIEYTKLTGSMERPPISSRFSKKSVRPSPEGKALRVAKSRKGQTLESTWRTITEGRPMPLARHLKKSDTWESRAPRNVDNDVAPLPGPMMRKAETFHEQGGTDSPTVSSGEKKVKREPSLSQDDLNRRVEAFIKKFNEDMRLQRQESFKHYMDMINRGADQ